LCEHGDGVAAGRKRGSAGRKRGSAEQTGSEIRRG
jgi:hypothetical protein